MGSGGEPVFPDTDSGKGTIVRITQLQLKLIAIGLIPVFFILSFLLPESFTTSVILAMVMIAAIAITLIGMRMENREAKEGEDLLAIPPKKP